MPSSPVSPRSITFQLVAFFTAAAAALLLCALGIFYSLVVRHAFEEDRAALLDKVAMLHATLAKPGGAQSLFDELPTVRTSEGAGYWIRVADGNGSVLAETAGMNALLPAEIFPRPAGGLAAPATKNFRMRGKLFGLASTRVPEGNGYRIQVAQDRSPDQAFTKEFGALLLAVLTVSILASVATAVTVAKRGLRPLAALTHSLQRISPHQLDERVAPSSWPRELQPVAIAFDDMLDRLEDSFTRLSQFSADLAHELRTPVANLRGEAEVALTRERSAVEYRQVIESSVAECERLSAMIENLLFLARVEAAEGQIEHAIFDGRETLEKIAGYYAAAAEEQALSICVEGAGPVCADPNLFGRALSNLLENALRHTPAGGTIRLTLSVDEIGATVTVQDSGVGIAAGDLPRVFDRLFRAESSRTSEGSGLGLAIVKSIAQLHGGSVEAASEPGEGATFTLHFPRAGCARESA